MLKERFHWIIIRIEWSNCFFFVLKVYIGAPTEEERLNILKSLCLKVPPLRKLDLDSVAKRTPGYVGQDLIRVAHLAILKSYVSSRKLNVLE